MIKALIIDDEESAINVIRVLLEKHVPSITNIETALGSDSGFEKIQTFKPDVIFLDIEMPGMTGFELLSKFPQHNFEVIFITAYGHYAIKAIRFSALDYLLKPIDVEELKNGVNRFIEKNNEKKDSSEQYANFLHNIKLTEKENYRLAISTTDGMNYFETADIIRCEADGNYTRFYLNNKKNIIASKTLKEYDEILREHNFVRIHRSHLVNKKYVKSYNNDHYVIMNDGSTVEVSRRKTEEVKNFLK